MKNNWLSKSNQVLNELKIFSTLNSKIFWAVIGSFGVKMFG